MIHSYIALHNHMCTSAIMTITNGILRPAAHCNTLQRTATHCNIQQHTGIHCTILQHTAMTCDTHYNTHCNTHYNTRCETLCKTLQHTAKCWNTGTSLHTMQNVYYVAARLTTHTTINHNTHCNTHYNTHCNILQHADHAATRWVTASCSVCRNRSRLDTRKVCCIHFLNSTQRGGRWEGSHISD